jgi:RNA polymerase sigma-70 factor, ECF subfamily
MTRPDLVERARRGEREAFAELAALEIDRLHATATLILRDMDLAQDAVQETLIRCWRQLPNLRDVASFEGWLYRILVRTAADEVLRRRRFRASVQALSLEPGDNGTSDLADRELLERAFARLSIEHRAVVVLRHYADLPLADVAHALGIPLGTAKSRYHYAMAELRTAIEAEGRLVTAAEGRA